MKKKITNFLILLMFFLFQNSHEFNLTSTAFKITKIIYNNLLQEKIRENKAYNKIFEKIKVTKIDFKKIRYRLRRLKNTLIKKKLTDLLNTVDKNYKPDQDTTFSIYKRNEDNQIYLLDSSLIGDSEITDIVFTGFSPSENSVFDPTVFQGYVNLGDKIINWLFGLGPNDPVNCNPHAPFLIEPDYQCQPLTLAIIAPFEPFEANCDYIDSIFTFIIFSAVFLLDLLCRLISSFPYLSFLLPLSTLIQNIILPDNIAICLLSKLYYLTILIAIITNLFAFVVVFISAFFFSLQCLGCLSNFMNFVKLKENIKEKNRITEKNLREIINEIKVELSEQNKKMTVMALEIGKQKIRLKKLKKNEKNKKKQRINV